MTWAECQQHEWEEYGDHDDAPSTTTVRCKHCGVPGERNDLTGEVFFPAT